MYIQIYTYRLYPVAIIFTSIFSSLFSPVYADEAPHEQTFVITAYYSPLPNQCCYFRGSYDEDIAFNGNGTNGADGTPVYPGMIAAPATYAFGTVIDLPGVGIGAVHDRGGRIIEWGDDIHRIDLWMGYGEEGLARALAWGARTMKGTVYPVGDASSPRENFSFDSFDADSSSLASLPKTDPTLLMASLKLGDKAYAVRILQNALKNLGYFSETPNGQFGPATQSSLRKFLTDYAISGDGSSVDTTIAASLQAAASLQPENLPDVPVQISEGDRGSSVRQAQKLLRYLGFYRGRTDGIFDVHLKQSVLSFQLSRGVIASTVDAGAGRIGPGTQAAILQGWKRAIVAVKSKSIAMKMDVSARVKSVGLPMKVLSNGDHGPEVRVLQRHLKDFGYLPASDITGTFGTRTEAALLSYQMDRKIVKEDRSKGAGVYGPATRNVLWKDVVDVSWKKVRAGGIDTL